MENFRHTRLSIPQSYMDSFNENKKQRLDYKQPSKGLFLNLLPCSGFLQANQPCKFLKESKAHPKHSSTH